MEPINRAQELSQHIQTLITEYVSTCPDRIDFFDIIEGLGLAGVAVLYADAVLHPQPIFKDEEFKTVGTLMSDILSKALAEKGMSPVVELIGVVTNMAHLSRQHNERIKEMIAADLASSEAEVATTAPSEN